MVLRCGLWAFNLWRAFIWCNLPCVCFAHCRWRILFQTLLITSWRINHLPAPSAVSGICPKIRCGDINVWNVAKSLEWSALTVRILPGTNPTSSPTSSTGTQKLNKRIPDQKHPVTLGTNYKFTDETVSTCLTLQFIGVVCVFLNWWSEDLKSTTT